MRAFPAVIVSAVALSGCAQMIAQQAMKDAQEKFAKCEAPRLKARWFGRASGEATVAILPQN